MLNNIAALLNSGAPPEVGDYESIATANGTGSSGVITFTGISSDYKHLQLRYIARTTQSAPGFAFVDTYLTFNSDTAANYSYHALTGNGTSPSAYAGTSANNILIYSTIATATADVFMGATLDILDYKDTNKFKTTRSLQGFDNNGGGNIFLMSGNWRSTSAITSITITTAANNFNAFSTFALYGIK
jgi:hypothetical protein